MNHIDLAKAFRKLGVESLNDMQKATATAMQAGKGDVVVLLSSSRFTNWSFDIEHASCLERSILFNSLLGHLLRKTLEYSKEDFDAAFEKYGDD